MLLFYRVMYNDLTPVYRIHYTPSSVLYPRVSLAIPTQLRSVQELRTRILAFITYYNRTSKGA